jgi:hypothetical protein
MSNITLPATLAAKIKSRGYSMSTPAQANRSGWTGSTRIIILPGAENHKFSLTFDPLATETAIREARAFFYALRGIANTFDLPYLPTPQTGPNTTVSSGGAAGATTVTVASAAGILPGMPISIVLPSGHKRLVVVISKAGNVLTFAPAMTENAAVGAPVEVLNPVCRVRLQDPMFNYTDDMGIGGFAVDVEEAL